MFPAVLPRWRLVLAALCCLGATGLCIWAATSVPHLGLVFTRTSSSVQRVLAAPVAGTALRQGDRVMRVSAVPDGPTVLLRDEDVLEEPDYLTSWTAQTVFFARQDTLAMITRASQVRIDVLRGDTGSASALVTAQAHPVTALPWTYWLQMLIGAVGLFVGAWVWSLKPEEWSARFYALTGLGFMIAVYASAVYGARELALPSPLFRWLSHANHAGGNLFAGALCALFLVYPRPLIRPAFAALLLPLVGAWWAANTWYLTPNQQWASGMLLLALVVTLCAALLQWRATRGDPADRAVLRWLGATVLTSCTAVIALSTLPVMLTGAPVLSQGLTFVIILPMYLGIAVGLREYRLFALDEWAFGLLFWAVTMAAVLLMDVWLIVALGTRGAGAAAIAAMLVLSTAPVRRWVWGRYNLRRDVQPLHLFRDVLTVTAAPTDADREQGWCTLLNSWFAPLHIAHDGRAVDDVASGGSHLLIQGRELSVPATSVCAALRLSYANGGARLFTPQDVRLVDTACALLQVVEESRTALAEGMRRERVRIARDLHDTVSSPLLAGLRPVSDDAIDALRVTSMQSDIQRAVAEMRSVVAGSDRSGITLTDLLADLRYTSVERLAAAGIQVQWPLAPLQQHAALTGAQRHSLTAFIQEVVTNVIRHAHAAHVVVDIFDSPQHEVILVVTDDGRGFDEQHVSFGDGLNNLHARAAELGGHVRVQTRTLPDQGTVVTLKVPLRGSAAA